MFYFTFVLRKYTGSGHLDRKILICDTVGNFVQELTPFLRKIRCGECTVDFQTVPKWSNISLDDNGDVFDNSALCLAYLYARHENVCASQHGPSLSRHFGGPRGLYRISRRLERQRGIATHFYFACLLLDNAPWDFLSPARGKRN